MNAEGEILLEQSGIIRSNCIDCLDRTNVTQVCIQFENFLMISIYV